ncbi:hypothetical protein J4429_06515 [Candidatus Pacearchaeota archaeon]|nr:hypothetical protein [Candidatus Pacearchaeota archaeon]
MELNDGKGPDVIDDKKFLEVKFCLTKPKGNEKGNYPCSWTVLDHQVEYAEFWLQQGFWGLGLYELDRPVKEIRTYDREKLESMVLQRELYIVEWAWMDRFPPHRVSGKTKYSQWKNSFRYPKFGEIPKIKRTIQVEKGLVYLTKGVSDYLFNLG